MSAAAAATCPLTETGRSWELNSIRLKSTSTTRLWQHQPQEEHPTHLPVTPITTVLPDQAPAVHAAQPRARRVKAT